jgi:hypothetical protein
MSDDLEPLRLLCTQIGIAMEDASPLGILTGAASRSELRKVIAELRATTNLCDKLLIEAEGLA